MRAYVYSGCDAIFRMLCARGWFDAATIVGIGGVPTTMIAAAIERSRSHEASHAYVS
jgi:hypothetical protein